MTYPLSRAAKAQPLSAADHDANLPRATLAALLADTAASYPTGSRFWTLEEGFRYRVAAPEATDHHLVTAGGVKLYVLPEPDGSYNFQAWGGVADGVTDNYETLMAAIYKPAHDPKIYFPPAAANYRVSRTIHLKRAVTLIGDYTGLAGGAAHATLRWPADTVGLWVNASDTHSGHVIWTFSTLSAMRNENVAYSNRHAGTWYRVTGTSQLFEIVDEEETVFDIQTAGGIKLVEKDHALLGPMPAGSAQGSRFEGIVCRSSVGTDKNAHGLHAQQRIFVERCFFGNWSGDGIYIHGASNRKNNGPGYLYGNANMCQVKHTRCNQNGGTGLSIRGYDGNAGYFESIDAVSNGRWGVVESSFLGNTHIGHHIAHSGNGRAAGNTSGLNSSVVRYDPGNGARTFVAHPDASEQQLVDAVPGTDNGIWWERGGTRGFTSGDAPTWQPNQPVGTYHRGGAMLINGNNNRSVMLYVYTEGGQGPVWCRAQHVMPGPGLMGSGIAEGGQWRTEGQAIRATSFVATGNIDEVEEEDGTVTTGTGSVSTRIGGNDSNGDLFMLRGDHGGQDIGLHRIKVRNGDVVWGTQNADAEEYARITGIGTLQQLGTGSPQPRVWMFRQLGVGYGSNSRRFLRGTAAPTSGAHARGDIVWNRDPSPGGYAGWICTTGGTPGTWKGFGLIEP